MNAGGSASLAATDIMDAIRVDDGGVLVVEKFAWKAFSVCVSYLSMNMLNRFEFSLATVSWF